MGGGRVLLPTPARSHPGGSWHRGSSTSSATSSPRGPCRGSGSGARGPLRSWGACAVKRFAGRRGRGRRARRDEPGAAILVAAALVVFAIQSLGWPEGPGRDLEAYLAVYVDFWHTNAVFPWEMLNRTPVAPLWSGCSRPRPAVARRALRRAAVRRLGPALRADRAPLRPRPGRAGRCGARPLSGLRDRVPRARDRDRVRRRLRGLDRGNRAGGAPSVRVVVCRSRPRDRTDRAHSSGEPSLPRRRDRAARARGPVAGADRPDGGLRRRHVVLLGAWAASNLGDTTISRYRGARRRTCRSSARSSSTTSSSPTTGRPPVSSPPP